MGEKKLYVVHCIDTEGPLYESLESTFERVENMAGVKIEPNPENLRKIQNQEMDLNGKEKAISQIVAQNIINYKDTWDKLDSMLGQMLNSEYRSQYADSLGQNWIYNWFVVDHVGYDVNPRRRDIGYHNIFDHYRYLLKHTASTQDELHWHFHPMSTYKEAHMCATSFLRSPHLLETLSRRIIERTWFPSCFRAGFHAERPDSHWFLEQWIPFDVSNQAMDEAKDDGLHKDVSDGKLGDWRRARSDWAHYHPAHDDYQNEGQCNRTIFRCLNVGTRFRLLDQAEVDQAFQRANEGLPTLMAFMNHDYRDMRVDVESVHHMLTESSKKYPEVQWVHSGAKAAAKAVLNINDDIPLEINVRFERTDQTLKIFVDTNKDTFGPQPFLAVKTFDQQFLTDNFDFQIPKRHWTYTFDLNTIRVESIDKIGIASNDNDGNCCVVVYNTQGDLLDKKLYI
jgi:hypothetical protein